MTALRNSAECRKGNTRHMVLAMTVDRIMHDYQLDRIDVLKVDIEGTEREVFGDTTAWIGKADSIIIELHEHMKAACNRSFYAGSRRFDHERIALIVERHSGSGLAIPTLRRDGATPMDTLQCHLLFSSDERNLAIVMGLAG
jgi:hypothetical protein